MLKPLAEPKLSSSRTVVDAPFVRPSSSDSAVVFCTCDASEYVIERACQALRAFVRLNPGWHSALVLQSSLCDADAMRVDEGVECVVADGLLKDIPERASVWYPAVTLAVLAAGELFPAYEWAVHIEPDVVAVQAIPEHVFRGIPCVGVQAGRTS